MKLVIFGLSISSSWGNGHATLWRGLCRALAKRHHQVVFYERNAPYYAAHRDLLEKNGGRLEIYSDWESVSPLAWKEIQESDVALVSSYCPDGIAASSLVAHSNALRVFYDIDTPNTLMAVDAGKTVRYHSKRGL